MPPVPFPEESGGTRTGGIRTRVGLAESRTRPVSQRGVGPPTRDPQRRAIDMRPDQRLRMLFQANLLRFRAFGAGLIPAETPLPARAIGLRKQKIDK